MAPKKGQKMSLNAFLEDNTLGSWADEMDALPSAPAPRTDEERAREFGRSDFSSRPDRAPLPPREDVPLPTQPPYTAFVGNLAFDMSEMELEEFFSPHKTVSVKIIADRDGKPKGFGYVEFVELEGLKDALTKSGTSLSHRTVRVNVAEPPKERDRGFSSGGFDDDKFSGNWRRDGPLPASEPPPRGGSRGGAGFGFRDGAATGDDDGPRRGARFTPGMDADRERERPEMNSDWRGSRTSMPPPPEREGRRGFGVLESSGAADAEETWSKGSKFRPSPSGSDSGSVGRKFGTGFAERSGGGPPSGAATPVPDEGDWRTRGKPAFGSQRQNSFERSPTNSTPPTPQLARKKLELLPRSGTGSTVTTPLSSPSPNSAFPPSTRANPFGAAKPVDVSAREKEVEERISKERDENSTTLARHGMSRETSRQATTRGEHPHPLSRETSRQGSTRGPLPRKSSSPPATATVRPTFSFANAAKKATEGAEAKGDLPPSSKEHTKDSSDSIQQLTEKIAEITV
ncbi:RNA-binding domain-containing protein [Ramaria rubella]|nr:RNA-binding domain-containing protein [Ramaria rubella]